jgi:hypothetical protein
MIEAVATASSATGISLVPAETTATIPFPYFVLSFRRTIVREALSYFALPTFFLTAANCCLLARVARTFPSCFANRAKISANWIGLVPGVGTVGWGHRTDHGFLIDQPLFRGANADVNMTLAMSLVFFACWIVWAVREVGVKGFVKELFAPKGESEGVLRLLMVVVFFAAGCLEVISILFRPVSLSFRLYGNIFAGENLLEAMSKLVPGFGWLVPIPFYFLELVMGLVQALVFMLLTAVFTMLICQHETEGTVAAHG